MRKFLILAAAVSALSLGACSTAMEAVKIQAEAEKVRVDAFKAEVDAFDARCADMRALEHMINRFQKLGQTSTQIILSTPVEHRTDLEIPARTHAPDA